MTGIEHLTEEQKTALRITKTLHQKLLEDVRDSLKEWEGDGISIEDAMSATLTAVALAMGDTMFAAVHGRTDEKGAALDTLAGITSHRAKEWAQLRLSGKDGDEAGGLH